jgi:hypothetical protein
MQGLHDSFRQEANIASYLILRKAMPELLNSPYLETFNKSEPENQERQINKTQVTFACIPALLGV